MRKRPIYGRSTRSTNSKAVTIKNHQKQSNYQVGGFIRLTRVMLFSF